MLGFSRLMHSLREHAKKGMREETPPRYLIDSVADFTDVPADRLDACLDELKMCVTALSGMKQGVGFNIKKAKFIWCDDGKLEGKINARFI